MEQIILSFKFLLNNMAVRLLCIGKHRLKAIPQRSHNCNPHPYFLLYHMCMQMMLTDHWASVDGANRPKRVTWTLKTTWRIHWQQICPQSKHWAHKVVD